MPPSQAESTKKSKASNTILKMIDPLIMLSKGMNVAAPMLKTVKKVWL